MRMYQPLSSKRRPYSGFHKKVLSELSSSIAGFGLVMAVDPECRVLTRSWCMLELAEANSLKMNLSVQVGGWVDVRQRVVRRLSELDIAHSASCKEDAAFLFSLIPEVARFNGELKRLLMNDIDGLFAQWTIKMFKAWRVLEAWRRVHLGAIVEAAKE